VGAAVIAVEVAGGGAFDLAGAEAGTAGGQQSGQDSPADDAGQVNGAVGADAAGSGELLACSLQGTGEADATGCFLPLVCTLNAARVLVAAAALLGLDLDRMAELALAAPPGAGGLTLLPYLEGERTPNRPEATGLLHGITGKNATRENLARAAAEGMLCGVADGLDAIIAAGVPVRRVLLIGGGARSEAVRQIAPTVFGVPVDVPPPGGYVADGAARQAAWLLAGGAEPPAWTLGVTRRYEADPLPHVRERRSGRLSPGQGPVSRRARCRRDWRAKYARREGGAFKRPEASGETCVIVAVGAQGRLRVRGQDLVHLSGMSRLSTATS